MNDKETNNVGGLFLANISPQPDESSLPLYNQQEILFSRIYTRLFHSFIKFLVNPVSYAIISPTDEKYGLASCLISGQNRMVRLSWYGILVQIT